MDDMKTRKDRNGLYRYPVEDQKGPPPPMGGWPRSTWVMRLIEINELSATRAENWCHSKVSGLSHIGTPLKPTQDGRY